MRNVEVQIGGKKIPFESLSYRKNVNLSTIDDFTLTVPSNITGLTKGDLVKIYVDGLLDFKGFYEGRELRDFGESGTLFTLKGRSVSAKLDYRIVQRELYSNTDPGNIVKGLNAPYDKFEFSNIYTATCQDDQDCYIDSANPNNNYNVGNILRNGTQKVEGSPARHWRSLLRMATPSNLSGVSVKYARIWLYVTAKDRFIDGFVPGDICLHRVTSSWTETGPTWNNQPTHNGTATVNFGQPTTLGWISGDVKSDIQLFADGTSNYGWKIKDSVEYEGPNLGKYWLDERSREYPTESTRPYIKLVYRKNESPYVDATASHNAGEALLACDSDTSTAWESGVNQAIDQYWKLDLGSSINLTRIVFLQDDTKYARNWKVEISTNGTDWTKIAEGASSTSPVIVVSISPMSARYVRIVITIAASYGWKILEVEAYKSTTGAILSEGAVLNFGAQVGMRFDYRKRLECIQEVADAIGWDAYATWDESSDYLNFQPRGEDKSDTVRFISGMNLKSVNVKDDIVTLINHLFVLGHGEGSEQLRAIKKDQSSIDTYGLHEAAVESKNLINQDLLNEFADALFDEVKTPQIMLEDMQVEDRYSIDSYNPGDYVYVRNDTLGIDDKFRVYTAERRFPGDETTITAGNKRVDLTTFMRSWLIKNTQLWADSSQEIDARTLVEP